MKKSYLDINEEPALQGGSFKTDPSEKKVSLSGSGQDEYDKARDSVFNEPALSASGKYTGNSFMEWLEHKRDNTSFASTLLITIFAGFAAAPWAVLGAFMLGREGITAAFAMILFAPVIEEMLKQSGGLFLLEKQPYRIRGSWQLILMALIASLSFASIENVLYTKFYVSPEKVGNWELFVAFRWSVCTLLHVSCSLIASLGLIKAWKKMNEEGKPVEISNAYKYLALAIAIHGFYNLSAMLFFDKLFD